MGRFNIVITEPPKMIEEKLPPPLPENSIAGVLALAMLGVAVILIVFGLWAHKNKR